MDTLGAADVAGPRPLGSKSVEALAPPPTNALAGERRGRRTAATVVPRAAHAHRPGELEEYRRQHPDVKPDGAEANRGPAGRRANVFADNLASHRKRLRLSQRELGSGRPPPNRDWEAGEG